MFYLIPQNKGEQKHHTSTCHGLLGYLTQFQNLSVRSSLGDCRYKYMLSPTNPIFFVEILMGTAAQTLRLRLTLLLNESVSS